jgi:endonuclease/exonuclease/phosphatase family metal-dependent hydrolase
VINTHLGLAPREQRRQAAALAGPDWLGQAAGHGRLVLLGDFNATGASSVYRTLTARLGDARRLSPERRSTPTFPSRLPLLRIDHIFVSPGVKVLDLDAPQTPATRAASDHLPLVMDFALG